MSNTQQQGRAEALIGKIEKDAREEAEKILAEAKAEAEAITREARRKARLKVHELVQTLRAREEREKTQEVARFETERRQWRQRDERRALAQGLTYLEAALNDLWTNKDRREQWCGNVLSVAIERLPVRGWRLEYPVGFPQNERAVLTREIESHTGAAPESLEDNGLQAGLRIYAGTACVDGSIVAVLADEQNTSAKFVSVLLAMREEETP